MPSRSRRGWSALRFCLLAMLPGWILNPLCAADVSIVIAAPVHAVTAGEPAQFWMNVLNPDSVAARFAIPGRIDARLQSAGRSAEVALEAVEAGAAAVVAVPPGGFQRREYRLITPSWARGTVILEFSNISAGSVAFEVVGNVATPESPVPRTTPGVREPTAAGAAAAEKAAKTPGGFHPIEYFKEHIYPYDPLYFIAGWEAPVIKFQISFKYQLLNQDGDLAEAVPGLTNLFVAYTQTSLWDWSAPSAPFFDSSYKPEVLYAWRDVRWGHSWPDWFRLDLEGGLQHESNGKDGADSRSMNLLYLRPRVVFGRPDEFQFSLAPKAWVYVGDLTDNPDMPFYRGYVELRAIAGWEQSVQLSATIRAGNTFERGSLSLDASYPLKALPFHTFAGYLYVQYFTGYGESLLHYNERSDTIRFGFALAR